MVTIYAIKSNRENWVYIGLTRNLTRRLHEHNRGYVTSTKARAPYMLIYTETQPTLVAARKREVYLKSGVGKEFLRKI